MTNRAFSIVDIFLAIVNCSFVITDWFFSLPNREHVICNWLCDVSDERFLSEQYPTTSIKCDMPNVWFIIHFGQ